MSEPNGTSAPAEGVAATAPENVESASGKGKGKSVEATPGQDVSMGADLEESSEEDEEVEEPAEPEEDDEDNMEEIDTSNIISSGRRTRGKTIDYEEAERKAKEAGDDIDEDEDDEDDDFEGEIEDEDQMRD